MAMTQDRVPPPERGGWEGLRPQQPSTSVPGWAVPVLIIGIACSVVVAKVSYDYFASGVPGLAMAYMFGQIPFLAIGVPCVLFGALGLARPRTARRPVLRIIILVGALVWWYLVLEGPKLLV
jgi:hypothetical protein